MKLLLAGGGTGGHLFPAIALAEHGATVTALARRQEALDGRFAMAVGQLSDRIAGR